MKITDDKVALAERAGASTAYAEREAPPRRVEAVREEKQAEKPHASEEIVIEEINIDGMCGVY